MPEFENRAEVAAKIEWEGGLLETLHAGVMVEDLPEHDEPLRKAWAQAELAALTLEQAEDQINDLLEPVTPDDIYG